MKQSVSHIIIINMTEILSFNKVFLLVLLIHKLRYQGSSFSYAIIYLVIGIQLGVIIKKRSL